MTERPAARSDCAHDCDNKLQQADIFAYLMRYPRSGLPELARDLADLCFPPRCLVCGLPAASSLCPLCWRKIVPIAGPICRRCGLPHHPAASDHYLCGDCLKNHWHFDTARAVARYHQPLSGLITAFKYSGKTSGLRVFAELFRQGFQDKEICRQVDIIAPVPLHPRRLRERGFNQSLELARSFFPDDGNMIIPSLLVRTRHAESQTTKSGEDRRRGMKGFFSLSGREGVQGKRVLLVDDVLTTGATVNECASVIREGGAAEVRVLTLARTDCDRAVKPECTPAGISQDQRR